MSSPHYTHDFLLNIGGINIGVYLGKNLQHDYFWREFITSRLKSCLLDNTMDQSPAFKIIFSGPRAEFRKIDKRTVGKQINYPQIRVHSLIFNNLLHPNLLLLSIYSLVERELAKNHILTLHASGFVMKDRSLLFCGDPGAGKSTALSLRPKESLVIGDDKILLHVVDDGIFAMASPFNDKVIVDNLLFSGVSVSGVLFIKKQGPARLKNLSPEIALPEILNQILTRPYNNQIRGLLLKTSQILSHKTYLLSYSLGENVSSIISEIAK